MVRLRDLLEDINVYEELEPYMDKFHRATISDNRIKACSPFRSERNPSFAVSLAGGQWVDSGASTEEARKGHFITLLAYFREESEEDTLSYLKEKYTHFLDDAEGLTLKLDLSTAIETKTNQLDLSKYKDVIGTGSHYLDSRGVGREVQRIFEIGTDHDKGILIMPWHDIKGEIVNLKIRALSSKKFWYVKNGDPVRNHVYGLFNVIKARYRAVWCTESEIDALYLITLGIPAVAFGGAFMSQRQKDLILRSGIEELIIATDNDTAGHRFADMLSDAFMGLMDLKRVQFPQNIKDVNELTGDQIKNISCYDVQGFKGIG